MLAILMCPASAAPAETPNVGPLPERVSFPSADGRTTLVGWLFAPGEAGRHPAVVMMHGRGGAYSSRAGGRYDASTLSRRHAFWGRFWAEQGYVAVLVDGFGPRGFPSGFARGTHGQRPAEVNEVTVRPLDADGALAWLRGRDDVIADRIGLQGWSNGGSAVLAAMAAGPPGAGPPSTGPNAPAATPATGFRAALAFYPGCGLRGAFKGGLRPYAPVRVLIGDADEEVSPARCVTFVDRNRAEGADIALTLYPGATHDFDDPGRARQRLPANAAARADAIATARAFFAAELGGR
ncbi:dienelactone hydrolase family protein [Rhodoplanes sp. SY1]|uniref:dienelactone hydrolase family protein n=1 Tax=Rhodoplanes sp. SY1 TaxID=3166646 RepID=UPI0038B6151A